MTKKKESVEIILADTHDLYSMMHTNVGIVERTKQIVFTIFSEEEKLGLMVQRVLSLMGLRFTTTNATYPDMVTG